MVVSKEHPHISEEELIDNLAQLKALLPDLEPGPHATPADLARLAARLRPAAACLLALRGALPEGCDAGAVAAGCPALLMGEAEELAADVKEALAVLSACPPAALRGLIESQPQLLLPGAAAATLDELTRLFGLDGADGGGAARSAWAAAAVLLGANPGLAAEACSLRGQARGDRDAAYLADTTRAGG